MLYLFHPMCSVDFQHNWSSERSGACVGGSVFEYWLLHPFWIISLKILVSGSSVAHACVLHNTPSNIHRWIPACIDLKAHRRRHMLHF